MANGPDKQRRAARKAAIRKSRRLNTERQREESARAKYGIYYDTYKPLKPIWDGVV